MITQENELEIGRRYVMGVNHSRIYAYTGKIEFGGKLYHEFLFLPTFLDIPPREPTTLQTKLLCEGEVIFCAGNPDLSRSTFNQAHHEPGTFDNQRLIKFLGDYRERVLGRE